MVTIRATAGDVPITSGVHVAASSTDFVPTLAVGTRSRGCAGLVSEAGREITATSTMLIAKNSTETVYVINSQETVFLETVLVMLSSMA